MLTACLIVKDEERMLGACLESVRDAVDEIVVYDTGSSDRTVQVAREAGATVVEGEWQDSFAIARNAALAHAKGEWVLSIDADERLQADPDALRAQLADPESDIEAYLVRDREPPWTGESPIRPYGDQGFPAAGVDMAAPAARTGRRGGRPRPPPQDRLPLGGASDPPRLHR